MGGDVTPTPILQAFLMSEGDVRPDLEVWIYEFKLVENVFTKRRAHGRPGSGLFVTISLI